jgi:hypothetical protein
MQMTITRYVAVFLQLPLSGTSRVIKWRVRIQLEVRTRIHVLPVCACLCLCVSFPVGAVFATGGEES